MAIMVSKEDDLNQELTERINADLREKMNGKSKQENLQKDPDFTEDSEYVKDFKKTGKFAWIWIVVGIVAVAALIIVGINNH